MVRVHVSVDHIADRLAGHRADSLAQFCPNLLAAQRVDYGDGIATDNEARIGHVAAILWRLHLIAALMNEHAWRDLTHFKRRCGRYRRETSDRPEQWHRRQGKRCPEEILARDQGSRVTATTSADLSSDHRPSGYDLSGMSMMPTQANMFNLLIFCWSLSIAQAAQRTAHPALAIYSRSRRMPQVRKICESGLNSLFATSWGHRADQGIFRRARESWRPRARSGQRASSRDRHPSPDHGGSHSRSSGQPCTHSRRRQASPPAFRRDRWSR